MTNYELLLRLHKEATLSIYSTTEDNVLVVSDAEAWGGWLKLTFDDHGEVIKIEDATT